MFLASSTILHSDVIVRRGHSHSHWYPAQLFALGVLQLSTHIFGFTTGHVEPPWPSVLGANPTPLLRVECHRRLVSHSRRGADKYRFELRMFLPRRIVVSTILRRGQLWCVHTSRRSQQGPKIKHGWKFQTQHAKLLLAIQLNAAHVCSPAECVFSCVSFGSISCWQSPQLLNPSSWTRDIYIYSSCVFSVSYVSVSWFATHGLRKHVFGHPPYTRYARVQVLENHAYLNLSSIQSEQAETTCLVGCGPSPVRPRQAQLGDANRFVRLLEMDKQTAARGHNFWSLVFVILV